MSTMIKYAEIADTLQNTQTTGNIMMIQKSINKEPLMYHKLPSILCHMGNTWGNTWSVNPSLMISHHGISCCGCGSVNASLCIGGYNGSRDITYYWPYLNEVEMFNGSIWYNISKMNLPRTISSAIGSVDHALVVAGQTRTRENATNDNTHYQNNTELRQGGSWKIRDNIIMDHLYRHNTVGSPDAFICVGGYDTNNQFNRGFIYTGLTYSMTSQSIYSVVDAGLAGKMNACINVCGASSYSTYTPTSGAEVYNGLIWKTVSNVPGLTRTGCAATGKLNASLFIGGTTNQYTYVGSTGYALMINGSNIFNGETFKATTGPGYASGYRATGSTTSANLFGGNTSSGYGNTIDGGTTFKYTANRGYYRIQSDYKLDVDYR